MIRRHSSASTRAALPRLLAALLPAVLILAASACSREVSGQSSRMAEARKNLVVPVTIATAEKKDVPVQIRAIGNVQPYSTVSIKAQVAGELTGVHFKEGQEVKKGDLLFTIDPRPFEAALKEAEAKLAKDRAQLINAQRQVQRYSTVVKKGYVTEESYDSVVATASGLEASVRAGEAAGETAKLQLQYCTIRSPISGVTGALKVNQGNIVKANDDVTPLVVINQTNPIYVAYAVPEQNLADIKKYMAGRKLEVLAVIPGDEEQPPKGELSFLDNTVDTTTGTILLKATFPNASRRLWPGQFVNTSLTLTVRQDVVVIPSQALQTGQKGQFVYILLPDSTAEYRPVQAGRRLDGEIIIESGVQAGETVVTDGQLKLAQGVRVKVVESPVASAEGGAQ